MADDPTEVDFAFRPSRFASPFVGKVTLGPERTERHETSRTGTPRPRDRSNSRMGKTRMYKHKSDDPSKVL